MQKSVVFFGANTPKSIKDELCFILGMSQGFDPGLYLGIPTAWGRSKKDALAFVKDRVLAKH